MNNNLLFRLKDMLPGSQNILSKKQTVDQVNEYQSTFSWAVFIAILWWEFLDDISCL